MGEIVTGQARQLEVGNLVQVAAIFRAQRQIFGQVEINSAAVNKRRLGLVIAAAIANADEIVSQRIGRTEKQPADSGQPIRPHSADEGAVITASPVS